MKTKPHITRRKALIFSGAAGLTGLAGCQNMAPGQNPLGQFGVFGTNGSGENSTLIPAVPKFDRKSDESRAEARRIFNQLDNRIPITPGADVTSQSPLSPQLTEAVRNYERVKQSLLANLPAGQKISYEDSATVLAPAVAAVVKTVFNEAAVRDKQNQTVQTTSRSPAAVRKSQRQGTTITIPHGRVVSYTQKGYCMDPSLPAPGKDDALEIRHISERVPTALIPLFQAVGKWAALPQNKDSAQSITWAIMGAGSNSSWAKSISPKALAQMDEAMPGGARTFIDYHNTQALTRALVERVLKSTKLDRYVDVNQLMDNARRDGAANALLQDLVRQGQAMPGGKGVGYSMLAPSVAARSTGDTTLTPRVQIVNASGKDFEFLVLDWYGHPLAPKQGTSPTNDILSFGDSEAPVETPGQGSANKSNSLALEKFFEDFLKDIGKFGVDRLLGWVSSKTPAASDAIEKGLKKALAAANLPNNMRKPLTQAAASAVSAVPVVGNLLSAYEFISGKDWFSGENLSAMERASALVGTVPGANALKAVSKAWKFGGSAAIELAAGKQLFKFVDSSEKYRILNDFIWSDTAANAMPSGVVGDILIWNEGTKETASKVLAASSAVLPWQKDVKDFFENSGKTLGGAVKLLPGI